MPYGKVLDDAVVGIWSILERVLALVEFYPGVSTDSRRMFFENKKIMLFCDEVIGIVILDDLPVFPFFNRRSIAHRTPAGYTRGSLRLVLRL